jgi:AraC family transcriptional regulator, activator of mtrCDE
MDLLANFLSALRLHTTVFARGTFCGSWAIDSSGTGKASFHLVLAGSCWLHAPHEHASERLETGDLVLFPRDAPHLITPAREIVPQPERVVPVPLDRPPPTPGPALVCGHFEFARATRNPVLDALPDHLVFRSGADAASWPRLLVERILEESRGPTAAGAVVIERLVDILFIEAVRAHAATAPGDVGFFAALQDAPVRRAIESIHREPDRDWSVAALATVAALSRSTFAARFQSVLGETPMQYVTRWRMQLAESWLREGGGTVLDVALRAGYRTEAAFNRAFKREMGVTPGAIRRARPAQPAT